MQIAMNTNGNLIRYTNDQTDCDLKKKAGIRNKTWTPCHAFVLWLNSKLLFSRQKQDARSLKMMSCHIYSLSILTRVIRA